MEFRNLPPEVLDLILGNQDTSWMVLRLWKCGNALLNTKLSSAITYIDLRHMTSLTSKYPRFLSCLQQLRHLSIHTSRELKTTIDPNSTNELTKLPKTLTSLSIVVQNFASVPFFKASPNDSNLDGAENSGGFDFIDVPQLFPQLQSLGIESSGGSKATGLLRAFPDNCPALPSTLTTLTIHTISITAQRNTSLSFLPRSLTHLFACVEINFPKDDEARAQILADLANAPPHLEVILELEWFGATPKNVSWMPQSLTSITVTDSWNLKTIRHAPPKLTAVTLDDIPDDCLQPWTLELPKCLTSLRWLPEAEHAMNMSLSALMALPRTLTTLHIRFYDMIAWSEIRALANEVGLQEARKSAWPPLLKDFDVRCSGFSSDRLELFPHTLHKLLLHIVDLSDGQSSSVLNCSLLPPALTKLELAYSMDFPLTLIGSLPFGLRTFSSEEQYAHSGFDATSLTALSTGRSLQRLDAQLRIPRPVPDTPLSLPSCISTLSLVEWPAKWFNAIPRTVSRLKIKSLYIPLNFDDDIPGDFFGDLPSGLQHLLIYKPSKGGFDGPTVFSSLSFSSLPSLGSISITSQVGSFTSSVLKNLPRNLKTLIISLSSFDPNDAVFLPPNLRTLRLGTIAPHVMDSVAEYWPVRALFQPRGPSQETISSIPQSRLESIYH